MKKTSFPTTRHPRPAAVYPSVDPKTGNREVRSRFGRQVTPLDLRRDPQGVAMTAHVRDGLQGAVRVAEGLLRPRDSREDNPLRAVDVRTEYGRDLLSSQVQDLYRQRMQMQHRARGTFNLHRAGRRGKKAGYETSPASFTLHDPVLVPHGFGQNVHEAASSYMMRPASQRPNFHRSAVVAGRTARESQLREDDKNKNGMERATMHLSGNRPSRMMRKVIPASLVPQTSARDNHYARMTSARVDSYGRPAGVHNVAPTGVSPAGIPGPADPYRAGLRRMPNAVHTTPILAVRNANAAGVTPQEAARGDGRNAQGRPLQPYMDAHGFMFPHRARTDFSTPNLYPARDAGIDKLLLETASRYAPDFRADLSDRMAASMVDRFPEPLQSRQQLTKEILQDFTSHKDRYMVERK